MSLLRTPVIISVELFRLGCHDVPVSNTLLVPFKKGGGSDAVPRITPLLGKKQLTVLPSRWEHGTPGGGEVQGTLQTCMIPKKTFKLPSQPTSGFAIEN